MADLGTAVSGIGEYLSTHRLRVPDYQRSYSWGEEGSRNEVNDLWDDLRAAIAAKQPEYFLGAVVTIRADGTSPTEVIDGQQRLATVSLCFAALRDVFEAHSDERAKEIEAKFLGEKAFDTRALTQFMVLNVEDNDVFRQLTLMPEASRTLTPTLVSHKRLIYAFEFFREKFNGFTAGKTADDWATDLAIWHQYVKTNAVILEVSVPNESRGFVIFETLNDRGLNLSTADLLKNHLFGKAETRVEEVKTRWAKTVAPFDDPDSGLDIDAFLRHFWASKKGVVRVKGLFSLLKPEVANPEQAVAFAEELQVASGYWSAMFDTGSATWAGYPTAALSALETLRSLNVEQCRPLLLAAMAKLTQPELQALLPLVVNWSIRWFVAGGAGAGTTERLYAETAKKVTEGTLTTTAAIATAFDTAVPNDVAFEEAMKTYSVRRGWLSRYLLSVLEKAQHGDPEPELVPNQDVDAVNLEHVLPKSPEASWNANFSSEQAGVMVHLLGNQCLLAKTPNRDIGNKPFAVKKPVLAASAFALTSEVGLEADWLPDSIRTRQARLAALAVTAWSKTYGRVATSSSRPARPIRTV